MLSPLQRRITRRFFGLPESAGFALAGGSALVLRQLVERATKDVDFFVAEAGRAGRAADALVGALRADGLEVEVARRFDDFARLVVGDGEDHSEVDLARDFQWDPAASSELGPVLSDRELAVNKLLALFGRAAARDFVDVFFLSRRFGVDALLAWAPEKDAGFDAYFLAENLGRIDREPRSRFAVDDATYDQLVGWYADLRARLLSATLDPDRPPVGPPGPPRAAP